MGRNETPSSAGINFGSFVVPIHINPSTRNTNDKTISVLFADNTSIRFTIPTKKIISN